MSHELTIRRDGIVEMAYAGIEQPWHGLGRHVADDATIDQWIEAAGMEWTVGASPVMFDYNGSTQTVSDRVVLHRNDTGAPLGVVSKGYKVVQPRETIEFFGDLIQGLGLTMQTAGTLFGGRKFWATGYIGEDAIVDNRDVVKGYVLLSTSADGSSATELRFTSVRVVCNNTLRMAHGAASAVRVLHSTVFDPATVKKMAGLAPKTFETFMADMRSLAAKPVSIEQATELTTELLDSDGPTAKRIMSLFQGEAAGADFNGAEGTAWGWLNAVTQFFDHDRKAKSDSHRMNTSLFGSADRNKVRALNMALELADA